MTLQLNSRLSASHVNGKLNLSPFYTCNLNCEPHLLFFDLMRVHKTGQWVNPHLHAPLHSVTLPQTLHLSAQVQSPKEMRELEHIWTWSHHLTKWTGAAGQAAVVCRSHLPVAWKNTAGGSLKPAPLKLKCAAEKRPGGHKSKRPLPSLNSAER